MTIERVTVEGSRRKLILGGRSAARGEKIVSLNLNGRRYDAEVSRWVTTRFRSASGESAVAIPRAGVLRRFARRSSNSQRAVGTR
jgi:hypothetical protein